MSKDLPVGRSWPSLPDLDLMEQRYIIAATAIGSSGIQSILI